MKQITQIGATVEEAIQLALQKLAVERTAVEVEVLQKEKKGFLGFGARNAEVRIIVKEVEEQPPVQVEQEAEVDEPVEEVSSLTEQQPMQPAIDEEVATDIAFEELADRESDAKQQKQRSMEIAAEEAIRYLTDVAKQLGVSDLKIDVASTGKYTTLQLSSEQAAILIGKRGQTLNSLQELTQLIVNKYAKTYMNVKLDVEGYRERRQASLEQYALRMADKVALSRRKISLEPMPANERKIIHNALANRFDIQTRSEGEEPNRYLVIEPLNE